MEEKDKYNFDKAAKKKIVAFTIKRIIDKLSAAVDESGNIIEDYMQEKVY